MVDPLMISKLQMSMIEGWFTMAAHMMTACGNLWMHQGNLMHRPFGHRFHDIPPQGVSLQEHYGRRVRDVDVEHMR